MVDIKGSTKTEKALIHVLDEKGNKKDVVPVCFYPSEYTMEKSNDFSTINIPGQESPLLQFSKGSLQTLTMDLFFDSYAEEKDVRLYTDKITNLLKIDPALHAPPVLKFIWSKLDFTCVLSRVSKKFTMFIIKGDNSIPVRATLNVTFSEYKTEIGARGMPLESSDRTKTYTIKQGDSLWSIAAREYGNPLFWRPIADENKIENPRLLHEGMEITIPPLRK